MDCAPKPTANPTPVPIPGNKAVPTAAAPAVMLVAFAAIVGALCDSELPVVSVVDVPGQPQACAQ